MIEEDIMKKVTIIDKPIIKHNISSEEIEDEELLEPPFEILGRGKIIRSLCRERNNTRKGKIYNKQRKFLGLIK